MIVFRLECKIMIITKKRIRNINPYLIHFKKGEKVIVGVKDIERYNEELHNIGFPDETEAGLTILPASISGSISHFNAHGKYIKHKDQPMETAYRQVDWHWTEWHGPYERIEQSKIVDVPYKRYPRSFIAPPAIELTIVKGQAGKLFLTAPIYKNIDQNKEILKHIINLFLEIFNECEVLTKNLESRIKTPLIRLNWVILPQGEMPWEQAKKYYDPIVQKAPDGNRTVLYHRLETVNKLRPDFRATGSGGFHGYIIHGFTDKKIYVLESIYYGNATYIFGEEWEELSKKTKAEILNEKLQQDRFIHREGWENKIKKLMAR